MGGSRVHLRTTLVAIVLVTVAALVASCGGTSSSGGQATPASTTSGSATPMSAADAQAVRDLTIAYWSAYNAYDSEKTLSYLDEAYRASQEKTIRDEIGQIKTFGVKLGVSEKSPPVLTGTDAAEMYVTMKEPTGTRTLLMKFARRGDVWVITFAEEVN